MYSFEVKALLRAPTASNASLIRCADQASDPLNSRCSRKWLVPASGPISSRLPVSTQQPIAAERTEGMSSVMTRNPLGSVVSW